MNGMLFDVPEQPSPRLRWMRRHDVHTQESGFHADYTEDEFGNKLLPWYAYTGSLPFAERDMAGGQTEDEAVANLAVKKRWRLWNEL